MIKKESIQYFSRLSPLQEGIFFHHVADPLSYCIQKSYRISGSVDIAALERSFQVLIDRNDIFRALFMATSTSTLLQVIVKEQKADFHFEKIQADENAESWLLPFKEKDRSKGFDLAEGPLMRMTVVQLREDAYELIWSYHHILMDGWCISVVAEEFFSLYQSLVTQQPVQLSAPVPYKKYIQWLEKLDTDASLRYWEAYLKDYKAVATLPGALPNEQKTADFSMLTLALGKERTNRLLAMNRKYKVTLNTVMQCIWGILLSKYNGTNDVVFGAVVSGRPADMEGVEHMIGLFINTIPVRIKTEPAMRFSTLLKHVQEQAIAATPHHYLQLAEVQQRTELGPGLIDHLVGFENFYPVAEAKEVAELGQLGFEVMDVESFGQTNYDFSLLVLPGEAMEIGFTYNRNKYPDEAIARIIEHVENLVNQLIHNPEIDLHQLDYMSAAEKLQVLVAFNATEVAYPTGQTVLDLFATQVASAPTRAALVFAGEEMTYQELDARSNQVAHYLFSKGIKADTLVPICLERSLEMIVGILGILKTGAAYLPIDPSYPAERIAYLLEDSHAQCLLTRSTVNVTYPALRRIEFDTNQTAITAFPKTALPISVSSSQLAYVIYTSGSTGKPKGVMLEHRGLVNLVQSQVSALQLRPGMRTLQFSSFGFDASCYEIFNALSSGGCLVLPQQEDILSADRFSDLLGEQRIELVVLPPSYQRAMRSALLSMGTLVSAGTIVSAGEALNREDALYFQSYGIRVINAYGPTENTVCSTWTDDPVRVGSVVIGKPIANVQVYFLDGQGQLCPVGIAGEMVLGGANLARGYWNRPELTAEKFIPNPFSRDPQARLYRTGDLGRWLPNGNIEYLGRIDDQVKVRGYRIELGEIESCLLAYEPIKQVAVLAKKAADGLDTYLVGYFESVEAVDITQLRAYLKVHLPDYMVPQYLLQLPSIPLTAHGKIAKKKLRQLDETVGSHSLAIQAPTTEMESYLVALWADVLKLDANKIGVDSDFFVLGGHSLKVLELCIKAKRQFSLDDVFNYPVLKDLAKSIAEARQSPISEALLIRYSTTTPKKEFSVIGFTYAGGNASNFKPVFDAIAELTDTIGCYAVALPRPGHPKADSLQSIEQLAVACVEEIKRKIDTPVVVWGHCAGTTLALEVARLLEMNSMELKRVFMGGKLLPTPLAIKSQAILSALASPFVNLQKDTRTDQQLKEWLIQKIGFRDLALLDEEEASFLIKNFRHDAAISGNYMRNVYTKRRIFKLRAPISTVVATDDPATTEYEKEYKNWQSFSDHVDLAVMEGGGHYFIKTKAREAAALIVSTMQAEAHCVLAPLKLSPLLNYKFD